MKLKEGDVFTIPLNEEETGFGQVVAFPDKSSFIIAVFDYKQKLETDYDLEKICKSKIIFLGGTFDGKLYHKHWVIIGNYKNNLHSIIIPTYKIGTPPGELFAVDYKGKKLRPITNEEFHMLDFQSYASPIRYENGLKAYYGFQDWNSEDFDPYLFKEYSFVL
jgi:hypothetical protein